MLSIITALKIEAVPLIEGLSLLPQQGLGKLPIYSSHCVQLGISGIGRSNAHKLTRYFLREGDDQCHHDTAHWLNFGIAGGADWEIGELVLAHTVSEESTGKLWTLGNNTCLDLSAAHVCTVQSPQMSYQPHKVYDMEAAGMISTLSEKKFLDRTLVLKLISDGLGRSADSLTKNDIQQLIYNRKKDILAVIKTICPASME